MKSAKQIIKTAEMKIMRNANGHYRAKIEDPDVRKSYESKMRKEEPP